MFTPSMDQSGLDFMLLSIWLTARAHSIRRHTVEPTGLYAAHTHDMSTPNLRNSSASSLGTTNTAIPTNARQAIASMSQFAATMLREIKLIVATEYNGCRTQRYGPCLTSLCSSLVSVVSDT